MKRLVLAGFLAAGVLFADAMDAGGVMLMIFPGAKAVGLGGAFTAISDDATATYYNPGGLGLLGDLEVQLTHSNWLRSLIPDAYYDYAAATFPTPAGNFALGMAYLTPGEVPITDENGEEIAVVKPFDVSAGLYYGVSPLRGLGVGVGVKLFYSYLVPEWVMTDILGEPGGGSALSFAVDGGVLYRFPFPRGLSVGAAISNIGPGISYSSGAEAADPLPTTLRLGLAYRVIDNPYYKLTLAATWHKVVVNLFKDMREEGMSYVLDEGWRSSGAELGFMDLLYLRFGYFHDRYGYRMGPTFGFGVKYGSFILDIADDSRIYEFNKGGESQLNLRFTLGISRPIGPSPKTEAEEWSPAESPDLGEKTEELLPLPKLATPDSVVFNALLEEGADVVLWQGDDVEAWLSQGARVKVIRAMDPELGELRWCLGIDLITGDTLAETEYDPELFLTELREKWAQRPKAVYVVAEGMGPDELERLASQLAIWVEGVEGARVVRKAEPGVIQVKTSLDSGKLADNIKEAGLGVRVSVVSESRIDLKPKGEEDAPSN